MSAGHFQGVHPRQLWTLVVAWAVLLVVAVGVAPAFAQSASFFSQIDSQGDMDAASDCQRTFSSALLAAGLVERPSAEVETLMRECVEDRSNPGFVRECDLTAARGQVNFVFLVGVDRDGEDWVFYVQALNPMMNGAVWQLDEITTASSALRAAREGCAYLAADFLYRQEFVTTPPTRNGASGGGAVSGGGGVVVPQALPAVVHIVSVTPSPATFYVNGQEVGLAPGQFEVPAGAATSVELRSPGYTPWTQTVTVAAGATERVSNVTLAALPATLQLTANVQGGEIVVDGAVVGSTILNRSVSVSVPSGNRQVIVRLEGFDEYRSQVTLSPGATQSLTATLSATQSLTATLSATQSLTATLSATPVGPAPAASGFVYIAPGTFMMGSPSSEEGRGDDETQHSVTLTGGFYLQTTEVTQGEWQRVMGRNPSYFQGCGSDCPVEQVSWLDAVGYANALSRADGLSECYDSSGNVRDGGSIYNCTGYRLPTEAEWEYAARAGTTGSRYGTLDQVAWYIGNSRHTMRRVGELQANAWGLHDMLGNVWELTHDRYGAYGGTATDPEGVTNGRSRVLRGGSRSADAVNARAAYRDTLDPDYRRGNHVGFRLARSAL
jgi:formylglycine-generating enzyme required for sulfatase activity